MGQYKCVNCKKVIHPMRNHICPYCQTEQPLEGRAKNIGDTIVDIECQNCGFEKSFYRTDEYLDHAYCPRCGKTTYANYEGKKPFPGYNPTPLVRCPYCNSGNTRKITATSKAASVALFGVFSIGKVSKQWHCNDCKSDF